MALRCRVVINPYRVDINLSRDRLAELLAGQPIDPAMQEDRPDHTPDDVVTLTVPAHLKRVGREMRMLAESCDDGAAADPSLLRIVARAHDIQARLIQNAKLTVHDIAREEQASAAISMSSCVCRPTSPRPLPMAGNRRSSPPRG